MGLFDTITWRCPACGRESGAQTKQGRCIMGIYDASAVPVDAAPALTATFECSCGARYRFKIAGWAPPWTLNLQAYVIDDDANHNEFDEDWN